MNPAIGLAVLATAVIAYGLADRAPRPGDDYDMAARSQMAWHQAAATAAAAAGLTAGQVAPTSVTPPHFYVGVEQWTTYVVNGAAVTVQPAGSPRSPLALAEALAEASSGDYGAGMVRGGWFYSATLGQMFPVPGVPGPAAAYASVLQ